MSAKAEANAAAALRELGATLKASATAPKLNTLQLLKDLGLDEEEDELELNIMEEIASLVKNADGPKYADPLPGRGRRTPHALGIRPRLPRAVECRQSRGTTAMPTPRHRGEPVHTHGTHGRSAHGHTDHTDEPHNHPNPTTHPHDRFTCTSVVTFTTHHHANNRHLAPALAKANIQAIIHITPPTYVYSQLTTSRHIRIWGGSVRVVTRRSGNVYALFTQSRRHSETHRYPAHRPDIRFSTHPIQRFNNRQPTLHSLRLIEEWAEELGNGQ